MKIISRYLPLVILMSVATACAINPVTGKKQITFMSEEREIALGQQSDPSIIAQFGLYDDQELQQFIQDKGAEMAAISHRSELDFEFKVLDSDVVNAFAVPGGYIYFTRGIMAHFNNEAQFAGVLGHEIGHIAARHSAQQYTKQMLTQIGFMAGMIASEKFRGVAQEAMQGMQLLFLKFSRTDESEADVLGVYYSSQVGYDAHQMAGFFQTLDRMSGKDGGRLPEFLSTHPDPGRRYQEVNRLADDYQADYSEVAFDVNRSGYLEMIDGIVYGADPRQGYEENGVFYHPELKFQYPVPSGWDLYNSPLQVQMAPEDGKALMLLMLAEEESVAEAAAAIKEKYKLTNINEGDRKVNGLDGYRMTADLPQQDQFSGEVSYLGFQVVLIKYNELIYAFYGLSEQAEFKNYQSRFDDTMLGFRTLTDPSKINVQPERIEIVDIGQTTTLREKLTQLGLPTDRHEEIAILNGMDSGTILNAGDKIKSVYKGGAP
jgi:predicted Zn-dependent protease